MMIKYEKQKEDVLNAYSEFLPIIEEAKEGKETNYDKLLVSLKNQKENIEQDRFLLMIIGEAKSGKSTFINAYLGEEILPMDVKQCTSSIVEIRYGSKFILTATYANNRKESFEGKQQIKDFLAANAAIDDHYRDIPVSTINMEILIPKQGKRIAEEEIKDLLEGIKDANIHKLSEDEYGNRVRQYIEEKKPVWKDIVKKIEIEYPFADPDLKGIEIIDTPGVNADGRVGDITNKYIERANAVMFLKPLVAQALESSSFKSFLNSKSADRNKNAIFLILTHLADLVKKDVARLQDEAINQNSEIINSEQIILVDSKAELFYKKARTLTSEELQEYIDEMDKAGELDSFIDLAWCKRAKYDRDKFLEILRELSNFDKMNEALNRFAHTAQDLMLSEFLKYMLIVTEKVMNILAENIDLYKEKAEDPIELGRKINSVKGEIEEIKQKVYYTVDEISSTYLETGSVIEQRAESVIKEYKSEIEKIDPNSSTSVDELEKISFRKIDKFKQFEDELSKEIVDKFDKALVSLSDKSVIDALKPEFEKESFDKIKEDMRKEAYETHEYTTGITFEEVRKESRFSQKKYYILVRDAIKRKIDKIKKQVIVDLKTFVRKIADIYVDELARNAKIKKDELDDIMKREQTAKEIQCTIKKLKDLREKLKFTSKHIKELKGGIEKYV